MTLTKQEQKLLETNTDVTTYSTDASAELEQETDLTRDQHCLTPVSSYLADHGHNTAVSPLGLLWPMESK